MPDDREVLFCTCDHLLASCRWSDVDEGFLEMTDFDFEAKRADYYSYIKSFFREKTGFVVLWEEGYCLTPKKKKAIRLEAEGMKDWDRESE